MPTISNQALRVLVTAISVVAGVRAQAPCPIEWVGGLFQFAGVEGSIEALESFDDGTGVALYVGGDLLRAGGINAAGIARWTGTAWEPVGSGLNGSVYDLVVFNDGF